MVAAEEKISFILYGSYEEQLNMLTDEQAGKWIKAIYTYVRTGEKHSEDPLVAMLLSVAGHQLDIDARKYAEKKERLKEAGRKGGLQKAKNLAEASHAANCVANLAVDVDEYVDADVDVLDNKTGRRRRQEDEEDACAREESNVVDKSADTCTDHIVQPYGKNVLPVLECELEQYQTFANGLMRKFMNRSAKEYDIRQVIHYTGRLAFTPDEKAYVVFDINRAELLEYVFERAAEQERMTWKYIDGIMENYYRRDVNSVREAMYNEAQWHAGNIFA